MDKDQPNTSYPRKSAAEGDTGDQKVLRTYAKNQIDALKTDLPRLVQSILSENVNKEKQYILPEFNPDIADNDPYTWYKLVDIHLSEQDLSGRELFIVISAALKGSALRWLSYLPYSRMTWPELKKLFKSKYCSETTAAAIMKFRKSKPAEGASLATYASEVATGLTTALEGLTTEQIVTAMVLAQVSAYDERLHRIALTTDISSLVEMQRELEAVPILSTQPPKRMRLNTTTAPITHTTTSTTDTTTTATATTTNNTIIATSNTTTATNNTTTTTTNNTTTTATNNTTTATNNTTTATNNTTTATNNTTSNPRRNVADLFNVLDTETVINVPIGHRVTCFKCWSEGHYEWECPQIAGPSDGQGIHGGRIRPVNIASLRRDDSSTSNSHLPERTGFRPPPEEDSD